MDTKYGCKNLKVQIQKSMDLVWFISKKIKINLKFRLRYFQTFLESFPKNTKFYVTFENEALLERIETRSKLPKQAILALPNCL